MILKRSRKITATAIFSAERKGLGYDTANCENLDIGLMSKRKMYDILNENNGKILKTD